MLVPLSLSFPQRKSLLILFEIVLNDSIWYVVILITLVFQYISLTLCL